MATGSVLEREEYIEQAYFFRVLRERIASNLAAQDIIANIHEEILATTRLPLAIQFLATELKHSGLLSSGFARLMHYFHPFQAFVIRQTEDESRRFNIETALLILEREAQYRSGQPPPHPSPSPPGGEGGVRGPNRPGLFVYQFEAISRNRLGYDEGLASMADDPFFDPDWREFLDFVRRQIGIVDFTDLVYLRSDLYVKDQRRQQPSYDPPVPPLFGEKEGRIAAANRGRDPLYLFAALQRQLGYPEVPRPRIADDWEAKLKKVQTKVHEIESRLKLMESELKGQIDLSQFGKPELLEGWDEEADAE
jgi:hypothetical protein